MNKLELNKLNLAIKSLHIEGDVYSYDINKSRRIDFPRGFLRQLNTYRSFLKFIDKAKLLTGVELRDECIFFIRKK